MKAKGNRVFATGEAEPDHANMSSGYSIKPVPMPIAETGLCKNYNQCKNYTPKPYQQSSLASSDLANGYCVICWDRGLDSPDGRKEVKALASRRARDKARRIRKRSIQMGRNTYMLG
tara:strand:- start:2376 stop:2726 length:351 start_codon:yes stop_codon:yes gene_type:complete